MQLSSDPDNVNANQDEIDYEFINGPPAKGPTGLWPNSWINGQRQGPEVVAATVDATSAFR